MQAAPLFVPDARPLYSVPLIVSLHSLWNPLMLKMLFCMLCRRSAILDEYGGRVGLFIGIQPSPSTRLGRKYLFYYQTKCLWTSCVTSNSILIQTRVFSFENLIADTTQIRRKFPPQKEIIQRQPMHTFVASPKNGIKSERRPSSSKDRNDCNLTFLVYIEIT